jgi:hypothetical protein
MIVFVSLAIFTRNDHCIKSDQKSTPGSLSKRIPPPPIISTSALVISHTFLKKYPMFFPGFSQKLFGKYDTYLIFSSFMILPVGS